MDTIDEKIEIADGFFHSGKFKKAIDYLTKIISENNNEYKAYISRGYAYFFIADTEKAICDLTHAIELYSKADQAYWYLAQIYISKTDYETAKEYIIKALEIDKGNFNYIGDFALIEQNLKNYSNCIELCSKILSYYPVEIFALNTRGYCFMSLKDYKNAIIDFESALVEKPHDCFTLNNLGFALLKNGEYKKAYKYLQLAIEIEPKFAYPYDNLGFVYYLDNDFEKALKLINTSIEIDQSNSWAFKNRALVYIATNNKEKAKLDLLHAKELGYSEEYDNEVEELLKTI